MAGEQVKVWDPLVRVSHWSLVMSFFNACLTEDDFLTLHTWAGYTVLGLVLIHIASGIIGTRHARFTDFVYSPRAVMAFVKATLLLRVRRYLGHNPASGAMILLMLVSLVLRTLTGLMVSGAAENAGPLADPPGKPGPFDLDRAQMQGWLPGARLMIPLNCVRTEVSITVGGDDDQVILTVEGDGPGRTEEQIEQLTRRGHRIDESTLGHGLGLSIVAEIVSLYRGEIVLGSSSSLGGFQAIVRRPRNTG